MMYKQARGGVMSDRSSPLLGTCLIAPRARNLVFCCAVSLLRIWRSFIQTLLVASVRRPKEFHLATPPNLQNSVLDDAPKNRSEAQVLTPEILVVGAGVAGATLAMSLHHQGFDVLLVDRLNQPLKIFKGEYIQPAALQFLQRFGIEKKLKSGASIRELRFRDIGSDGKVLSDILMKYPKGLAARSCDHEQILSALFERAAEVLAGKFWRGTEITPLAASPLQFRTRPRLLIKRKNLPDAIVEPRWVVGCDGRSSSVRKWAGGPAATPKESVTVASGAEWIIGFEVETAARLPHRYEVFRSFGKGTTSLFSLSPNKQRLYYSLPMDPDPTKNPVRLAPGMVSEVWESMEKEGFEAPPEKFETVRAHCAGTAWYGPAAMSRVLLAGDALAVTTPFGGQGMSAACENVGTLVENFPWRTTDPATLSQAREDYNSAAKATHKRINLMNFGLYQLFFNRSSLVKLPTRHIVNTWQKSPELTARVMRLFAGVDTDHPSNAELLKLWGMHPAQQLQNLLPHFVRGIWAEL